MQRTLTKRVQKAIVVKLKEELMKARRSSGAKFLPTLPILLVLEMLTDSN